MRRIPEDRPPRDIGRSYHLLRVAAYTTLLVVTLFAFVAMITAIANAYGIAWASVVGGVFVVAVSVANIVRPEWPIWSIARYSYGQSRRPEFRKEAQISAWLALGVSGLWVAYWLYLALFGSSPA